MLADMLASGLNAHVAGGQQAPVVMEETCLHWLAELMGMPPESSGLLTTGATMANLTGLAVARHAKAGYDIRKQGLQGCTHPQLLVYGSTETHSWAQEGSGVAWPRPRCISSHPGDGGAPDRFRAS